MVSNEQDLRHKLVKAAQSLMSEVKDVEKVTVRQIAERAGVGTGLVNYHFKSKDNLMSIAIGDVMARAISEFMESDGYSRTEPIVKLKKMLKKLCDLAGNDKKLIRFMMLREMTEGSMQAPLYIVPLLKEIFGGQKDDMQLRIIALQLIQPIQASALNTAAFYMYSGIDLGNSEQRGRFIDALIENLTAAVDRRS
ncbi:MAG: TetR/AcrR family transcriptional regulator [Oscillospiraceae bacterium]|jgi:AcrR family transcriptional regulator|nr:TetR/AcrR family transcriptional regulator [Oscillospiraceae bacterium]